MNRKTWHMKAAYTLAMSLVVCVLVGCVGGAPAGSDEQAPDSADVATPSATPAVVRLGFAGDICFADDYLPMEHLAELGSTSIADGIDSRFIDLMRGEDVMWINNEFCYSTRGEPLEDKAWTFRSAPEHVKYLHDLGVDVVGLANNHVYDYGPDAFMDTLSTLEEADIPYGGAGRDIEAAMQPVYVQVGSFTVAYVAASRAEKYMMTPQATAHEPGILQCYDMELFLKAVRRAAEQADYVVALPHWGTEHSTELEEAQTQGAHQLIDAGADIVIGAHPHILQGMEYYDGKPILYSLGNFWFDDYDIDTLVAEVDVDTATGQAQVLLHPGAQSNVYTAWAETPEERARIFADLQAISVNAAIAEDGTVHEM